MVLSRDRSAIAAVIVVLFVFSTAFGIAKPTIAQTRSIPEINSF
jgi:hypothetical protein